MVPQCHVVHVIERLRVIWSLLGLNVINSCCKGFSFLLKVSESFVKAYVNYTKEWTYAIKPTIRFAVFSRNQEELKIRREKEAEIIRQQEFLRNSLRASKQLRALADNLPVSGLVNEAYDEEGETYHVNFSSNSQRANKKNVMVEFDLHGNCWGSFVSALLLRWWLLSAIV